MSFRPAIYDHRARDVLRQHTADAPWDPQRLLPVVWQFSRGDGEQVTPSSTPDEVNGADHLRALHHAGAPGAVNVGQAALPILSSSKNIHLLLHANATSIETNEEGSKVQAVSIATLDGRKSTVRATCVVLACGGIDNARLLLASGSSNPRGLGNANDMVGRFLIDHPLFEVASYDGNGSTLLRRQLGYRWLDRASNRFVYQKGMRLSPDLQRREELLNCAIHVLEYSNRPPPISLAGSALRSLRRGDLSKDFTADLFGALKRPHEVVSGAYERYALRRPSLQKANPRRPELRR